MDLPLRPSRPGMARRSRTRLAFLLAGMIAVTVVAAVLLAVFGGGTEKLLPVGSRAPEGSGYAPRGAPLLIEFCATWSSVCAKQVPALNRLAAGQQVVSVNGDSEDRASVDAFRRDQHARFPVVLDPGSKTVSFPERGPRGPLTAKFHVTRFPTIYVLDAAGRIRWRAAGLQPYASLARKLRLATRPLP
jgi:hypothetical protein